MGGPIIAPVPQPFLFLPARFFGPRPLDRRPSAADFLILELGYREVFGQATTVDALRERLDRYNLRDVLDVVSRINALLYGMDERERNTTGQRHLCAGLFGARAPEVWAAVVRHAQNRPEARAVLLFGELQLVNFIKVALLVMPTEERNTDPDLGPLGEAMLMVWDLCMEQMHEEPMTADKWQQIIVANGLFHAGGRWQHDLARSHDLYLSDKNYLHTDPDYVDLPSTVQALTGLSTQTLWAVLYGFLAHWRTIGPENIAQVTGGIDSKTYFTHEFSFTAEQIEHFFAIVSAPAAEIQTAVRDRYSLEDLQPLDVLPLARAPLLSVGDRAYCVSTPLLSEKLTRGLYHIFLDPGRPAQDRNRFLRYCGRVFEDYVDRLLRRVYAPGRYIDGADLKAHLPGRSCDGMVLFLEMDAVVLLETKSTIFSLDVRSGRNWALYQRNLSDLFIDAALQLNETIDGLMAGRLRPIGMDPRAVHSCLPVVVTLDEVAVSRPMYDGVMAEVRQQGLLAQREALPLQIVTIGELESLEADIMAGLNLQRLLAEKGAQEEWRGVSLRNYCYALRPALMGTASPFLASRNEDLFQEALRFFRAHGPGPEVM